MTSSASTDQAEPSRWAILALLGVAQLMVVLDATIVNIALPSAQKALGFSTDSRQWVITAYALAFGSLLLLGGKLGDLFGRKWTFIGGLIGFSLASVVGGFAQSFGMLVTARAFQGVFGALLAPSALSLLTVTFADSPDRPKAFGIFGAIAGGGASAGLLLGGALTQALSWRWCLYVNLVIAVPTAIISLRVLVNHRSPDRPRIDVPGLLAGSVGLFAVVYGFSNAETNSWTAPVTIIALAASVVLLTTFVLIEQRSSHPLLPLHIITDRARGGAYASILLAGGALFGVFIFLTYFLQDNLALSPLSTGVAFLPMTALIVIVSTTAQTKLVPRFGPKALIMFGMTMGVIGMGLLTRLSPSSDYASDILPSLLVLGLGMGSIFAPAFGTATLGVPPNEAGVASAMVNTCQQVGGSIGTSLLSTLFASSAASFAVAHHGLSDVQAAAMVHGYTTAFWWSVGIFAVGLGVAVFVLPWGVRPAAPGADPSPGGEPGQPAAAS
jgi:EmrB/QacA subfamily drug resistance transporter